MASAAVLSHPSQMHSHDSYESVSRSRSSIASCPSCGHHLSLPENDSVYSPSDYQDPVESQRRIQDLEAQVKLLNAKASSAVDKLADYEDEVRFLRAAYSGSQDLQQQQQDGLLSNARHTEGQPDPLAPSAPIGQPQSQPQLSRLASLSAFSNRIRDSVTGISLNHQSKPSGTGSDTDTIARTISPIETRVNRPISPPPPSSSLSYFNFGVLGPSKSAPNLIPDESPSHMVESPQRITATTTTTTTTTQTLRYAAARSTSDLFASFNPFGGHHHGHPATKQPEPEPTNPDTENKNDIILTSLQSDLETERNLRLRAESSLNQTQTEIEELTAQLFGQANEMVATERKARFKLEERVKVLEGRDREKRKRIERLEGAMERIERVRVLVGPENGVAS